MPIDTDASVKHVAVFAFPFGSHAQPLLSLVRRLSSCSPDTRFSFFSTEKSNATIFRNADAADGGFTGNIKPWNIDDGLPEGYTPSPNPLQAVQLFLMAMPENYTRGLAAVEEEIGLKITCLISDAFLWFSGEIAQERDVPWVPLWTSGPQSLLAHVCTDLIRQEIGTAEWEDKTMDSIIPGFESAIRAIDLPEGVIKGDLESSFSCMAHKMGRMLPRATAVVLNSFDEVDTLATAELRTRLQKLLNVGPTVLASPPPLSDQNSCLPWLDHQEPSSVVYVSFGSVITLPPCETAALAQALEETSVPFLWSLRGKTEHHLPQGFTERTEGKGKIVSWAPQLEILRHPSVGAFVTHCGWNSLLESIIGGVPMVVRPFFGDQPLNCRVIEKVLGIGVSVEGGAMTANGTVDALNTVLFSEEGKCMKEKVMELGTAALQAMDCNGSSAENFKSFAQIALQATDIDLKF